MTVAVLCGKDEWHSPATAQIWLAPQPFVDMLGKGAHIEHHQLGPTKDVRVDALEDKVFFSWGIQSNEERVIDVAIAIFVDIQDMALWLELPGD